MGLLYYSSILVVLQWYFILTNLLMILGEEQLKESNVEYHLFQPNSSFKRDA